MYFLGSRNSKKSNSQIEYTTQSAGSFWAIDVLPWWSWGFQSDRLKVWRIGKAHRWSQKLEMFGDETMFVFDLKNVFLIKCKENGSQTQSRHLVLDLVFESWRFPESLKGIEHFVIFLFSFDLLKDWRFPRTSARGVVLRARLLGRIFSVCLLWCFHDLKVVAFHIFSLESFQTDTLEAAQGISKPQVLLQFFPKNPEIWQHKGITFGFALFFIKDGAAPSTWFGPSSSPWPPPSLGNKNVGWASPRKSSNTAVQIQHLKQDVSMRPLLRLDKRGWFAAGFFVWRMTWNIKTSLRSLKRKPSTAWRFYDFSADFAARRSVAVTAGHGSFHHQCLSQWTFLQVSTGGTAPTQRGGEESQKVSYPEGYFQEKYEKSWFLLRKKLILLDGLISSCVLLTIEESLGDNVWGWSGRIIQRYMKGSFDGKKICGMPAGSFRKRSKIFRSRFVILRGPSPLQWERWAIISLV